jgi:hypothetical protein
MFCICVSTPNNTERDVFKHGICQHNGAYEIHLQTTPLVKFKNEKQMKKVYYNRRGGSIYGLSVLHAAELI